ncbi:hypothetical protein, partial [Streptomyces mirabilis]|uniref:hypothetical protein n=1 Tax=Streptomyces mirabilis TaxID=68239 RepID=UPI0036EAA4D4
MAAAGCGRREFMQRRVGIVIVHRIALTVEADVESTSDRVAVWHMRVTSAGVVYRRPLGDLVLRLCGEFGGQGGLVG